MYSASTVNNKKLLITCSESLVMTLLLHFWIIIHLPAILRCICIWRSIGIFLESLAARVPQLKVHFHLRPMRTTILVRGQCGLLVALGLSWSLNTHCIDLNKPRAICILWSLCSRIKMNSSVMGSGLTAICLVLAHYIRPKKIPKNSQKIHKKFINTLLYELIQEL